MKQIKFIGILVITLMMSSITFGQKVEKDSVTQPKYNLLLGKDSGKSLTNENLCIIIGSGEEAINSKGKDMLWVVDWNEPLLKVYPEVLVSLKKYRENFIDTKKDTKETRTTLLETIIKEVDYNNQVMAIKYRRLMSEYDSPGK